MAWSNKNLVNFKIVEQQQQKIHRGKEEEEEEKEKEEEERGESHQAEIQVHTRNVELWGKC